MGDISTWNPVDNSNTAAPPDGWPESMQPSAVNNSARAMMGAVRRWYDTVSPLIASITSYLPLTGGTLTGALYAPYLHSSGDVQADGTYTGGAVNVTGTVHGAQLTSAGNINASGNVNATADVGCRDVFCRNISGTLATMGQLTSTGNANVNGTLAVGANASVAGTIIAGGNITAPNFIGNVSVPANGPVSTGGTVTGGQVTSTGNASVAGTMTAGSVSASSDITAAGSVTGGSMHCMGTMQTDGQSNLLGPVFIGPGGAWARIDSSGTYNVTGSWQIISGRAGKENIVDYDARGLAAVLALRPVSFNYRPEVFGPEEAEKVRYGLVADEVAPVVPEMVGEAVFGDRNLSTLNMGHLNIVLVRACQDLAAQNAALAARITALEGIQ